MAIDRQFRPSNDLPQRSRRYLRLSHDCWLYQSFPLLKQQCILGCRSVLAYLHLHLRFDRGTYDM
jgi:hypothetical protein